MPLSHLGLGPSLPPPSIASTPSLLLTFDFSKVTGTNLIGGRLNFIYYAARLNILFSGATTTRNQGSAEQPELLNPLHGDFLTLLDKAERLGCQAERASRTPHDPAGLDKCCLP